MTITLNLPTKLEKKLSAKAAEWGVSAPEVVLRILEDGLGELEDDSRPQTGAELVAYLTREGIIGAKSHIKNSRSYARKLRRRASRRENEA
jgi:hypothetical protein